MQPRRRDVVAHLLRIAACLLMLAAAAVVQHGRILGREMLAAADSGFRFLPSNFEIRMSTLRPNLLILAVLLLAAVVPLFTKSRRWRTVQLWLDVAVLGLWTGAFLSTARLVGWAGSGLPGGLFEWIHALLLLSMAFLYPVFGRPSHYCLHVCPFGAAQELAGRLPVRKRSLSPSLVRGLTEFRRTLWAALMLVAWCNAAAGWMEWELFGAFAWRAVPPLVVALAVVFLVLAVFTPRPYCRFVCPTGTLLKLAEANRPEPSQPANRPAMKAADYINVLLATALVILCIKLYETREALAEIVARDSPAKSAESVSHAESAENAESENTRHSSLVTRHSEPVVIDSTDLAPGVSGFGGPVPVLVEVKDGVVASVAPKLPNDETPGFFRRLDEAGLWKAWDGLPVEVAATARVDAVTSATYSSKAAIENVRAALEAAKKAER